MRSRDGRETWRRLLAWDREQAASERLAGHILRFEGFRSIDPSHPLGGRDGLKDIICARDGKKWIGAAYFPRDNQPFAKIAKKLAGDLAGISKASVDGLAFVTNQELTLAERADLRTSGAPHSVEVFHLERIASILDSPQCYGIRLEFLDIEMTKEEQLAVFAQHDMVLSEMKLTLDALLESSNHKRGKANPDMPIVRPRSLAYDGYSITSLNMPQPRECHTCHEIFLVDSSPGINATIGLTSDMKIITCPYCGHSERFYGWPYR
jgi:hypothetical protein